MAMRPAPHLTKTEHRAHGKATVSLPAGQISDREHARQTDLLNENSPNNWRRWSGSCQKFIDNPTHTPCDALQNLRWNEFP